MADKEIEDMNLAESVLIILLIIFSFVYYGFIIQMYWNWFVVPLNTAIPYISMSHAYALYIFSLIMSKGIHPAETTKVEQDNKLYKSIIKILVTPTLILAMGAFIKYIIM